MNFITLAETISTSATSGNPSPTPTSGTGNPFFDFFKSIGDFFITPDENGLSFLGRLLLSIAFLIIGLLLCKLIKVILRKIFKLDKNLRTNFTAKSFAITTIDVVLKVFVAFSFISMIGIDMRAFAGIISAVTVALGLAVQDLIGALTSGIILIKQKYFDVGDHIIVVNQYSHEEGFVEKIGLFYTKLLTFDNESIIIANNLITKANVKNMAINKKRRLFVTVPLPLNVDIDEVTQIIKDGVHVDKKVLTSEVERYFIDSFTNNAMIFGVKVWSNQDDYWDVYFNIRGNIYKALRSHNIVIPTVAAITIKENNAEEDRYKIDSEN